MTRIKVDEKNSFGMLEWPAVRYAAQQALPRRFTPACWKHAASSEVEQDGVRALPKDRGAEQGDVDGPLECSPTLGLVAKSTRQQIHAAQRNGTLPWMTHHVPQAIAAQAEFDERAARSAAWEAQSPELRRSSIGARAIIPDPKHEI